ncbi:hypothetical protein [Nonomuraea solani]|nr:hypothetical protein [Nonomuraea solani]
MIISSITSVGVEAGAGDRASNPACGIEWVWCRPAGAAAMTWPSMMS